VDQSETGAAKSEMAKHELYGAHAIMKALFAVLLSLPSLFAKLGSRTEFTNALMRGHLSEVIEYRYPMNVIPCV
jgi:hypothetical protein